MKKHNRRKWFWAYLFLAPSVILICILNIWPIIQTIWFSLNEVKGFQAPEWVGIQNYINIFHDREFGKALLNTVIYTIVSVPVGVILSLIAAVFLNSDIKCKGFFRVCYFLPVISAPAAVAMVWRWLYNWILE